MGKLTAGLHALIYLKPWCVLAVKVLYDVICWLWCSEVSSFLLYTGIVKAVVRFGHTVWLPQVCLFSP